jgi:acyl carrier protein
LGLDSLDLAIVIERLEDALGVDPFTTGEFAESPVTLGDLIRMYERSLSRFA